MSNPLFWLGLSILLVAVSLTALLIAAIPALQELARAARSAEKLFDTLSRELPPTLDSIRMTGLELTDLSDDVSESVRVAGDVVKQVDDSLYGARKQAESLQIGTRSFVVGVRTAWKTFTRPKPSPRSNFHPPSADSESLTEDITNSPSQPQLTPAWKIRSPKHQESIDKYDQTYDSDYYDDEEIHPKSLIKDD